MGLHLPGHLSLAAVFDQRVLCIGSMTPFSPLLMMGAVFVPSMVTVSSFVSDSPDVSVTVTGIFTSYSLPASIPSTASDSLLSVNVYSPVLVLILNSPYSFFITANVPFSFFYRFSALKGVGQMPFVRIVFVGAYGGSTYGPGPSRT